MTNISRDEVKKTLKTGGKYILDSFLESCDNRIFEMREETFANAIEIGITNTILSLYNTGIKDDEIIRVLNKYWGIDRNEAILRLVFSKRVFLLDEIEEYFKLRGHSSQSINQFMRLNTPGIKIRNNPELLELRYNIPELIKRIENKEM